MLSIVKLLWQRFKERLEEFNESNERMERELDGKIWLYHHNVAGNLLWHKILEAVKAEQKAPTDQSSSQGQWGPP